MLHMEALTPAFGTAFWAFVEKGGYKIRQSGQAGRPILYRFQKPTASGFPAMLELFCRAPEGIRLAEGAHLTPIPFEEAVASLSAILLDDDYYTFLINGRRNVGGLPWLGAEQLIPLKACAWLDLSTRKIGGEKIDSKDIRKHGNDVIRLAQLLAPDTQVPLAPRIADDFERFLASLIVDGTYSPKDLQLHLSLTDVIERLRQACLVPAAGHSGMSA